MFCTKKLERELKQQRVLCENHKHGCAWSGELGHYDSHLYCNSEGMGGCLYATIESHNECGEASPRQHMLFREMEECSLKQDSHTKLGKFYNQEVMPDLIQTYVHESATVIPVQRTIFNFTELQKYYQDYVSQPFYTHPGGYKMCLWVFPNGYGDAKKLMSQCLPAS